MWKKLHIVLVLPCMLSYAVAAAVALGTVSARGNMWVDNYGVMSNATLFDGTVVATAQASAILRLYDGVEITMASDSRAALHRGRLVLQQGESELAASTAFQIEANGLRIASSQASSHGVVSIKPGSTVEVAALAGSFGVTTDQGILLATVRPGQSISFATQANADPSACEGTGTISLEGGNYFITIASTGVKYGLTGTGFAKLLAGLVGKPVTIKGTIVPGLTPAGGATAAIALQGVSPMVPPTSTGTNLLIGGRLIVAGVGRGTGVSVTNQPKTLAGVP
jgi:hypothetical protein